MIIQKLKKYKTISLGLFLSFFFPLLTLAAPANFKDVILIGVNILKAILPVIVSLAVIYFLWGITQYIKADEGKKEDAKTIMIHGIIALFVMTCVWGFVWILTETFIPNDTHYPTSFSTTNDWNN